MPPTIQQHVSPADFSSLSIDDRQQLDICIQKLRAQRTNLIAKLSYTKRDREINLGRNSTAARKRMKKLLDFAGNDTSEMCSPTNKRRRAKEKALDDDSFGANDADWEVYTLLPLKGERSSEATQLENLAAEAHAISGQLEEYDRILELYDPQYNRNSSSILSTFFGTRLFQGGATRDFTICTEMARSVEPFFNPSIAGLDQMGLSETVCTVLEEIPLQKQHLFQELLLNGGCINFKGFRARLQNELQSLIPYNREPLQLREAGNPLLDAWKGAAKMARMGLVEQLTIEEWEENGPYYRSI